MTRFFLRLPCLWLLLVACGETDTLPQPQGEQETATRSQPAISARFDFVSLSRLQAFHEGVPCDPNDLQALPATAAFVAELRKESDHALLVCIDDALLQLGTLTSSPASKAGTDARAGLLLEVMAAAKVDLYVPGYGDFQSLGVHGLLDRAEALGIPVLVSNMDVTGREDAHSYLLLEAGGITVGCLSAIPAANPKADREPGVTIVKPVRRIKQLAKSLLESGQADMIVVFSALSDKTNQRLSDNTPAHFIIGSNQSGQQANRIVQRKGTSLMSQRFGGVQAGHTTLKIVDGNFSMVDLSALWSLPKELEIEGKLIDGWMEQYETDDLDVLVQRISPIQDPNLEGRLSLRKENEQWLIDYADYKGSYVAHREAALRAAPAGNAASSLLARQASVIESAVMGVSKELKPIDPTQSILGNPETCIPCHRDQYEHWAGTEHSGAFATLQELGRGQDGTCLVCHADGYNKSGGYQDPRHEAPFGAVSCWACHRTYGAHATLPRGSVDPALCGAANREYVASRCASCHAKRRSPDFDLEKALEIVACPPMRPDDPHLARSRSRALAAIERHRQEGTSDYLDLYRKGRALAGLGRIDDAVEAVRAFALQLAEQPAQTVEVSRFLDAHGASSGALEVIREYLSQTPSDPLVNTEYVRLLLSAEDETAQDPRRAESHLRLVVPDDGDKIKAALIPMRMYQVEALFRTDQPAEAFRLLHRLNTAFPRHDEVQEFVDLWLTKRG